MKNKQAELIKDMSDSLLVKNVWLTQFLLLFIALVLGSFLFDDLNRFLSLFELKDLDVIRWGVTVGVLVVCMDILFEKYLPESYLDDGGINERIFRGLSVPKIAILTLMVAFSEEILFRGIIQYHTNIWIASILFGLVHYRYLFKPFLFLNVMVLSFVMGLVFQLTGNLLVTIAAHFIIDFILGVIIRCTYRRSLKR
ncbi:MAG: lysostaphin resistance A-like protein [Bacillus sp. (in: firmicutes)]